MRLIQGNEPTGKEAGPAIKGVAARKAPLEEGPEEGVSGRQLKKAGIVSAIVAAAGFAVAAGGCTFTVQGLDPLDGGEQSDGGADASETDGGHDSGPGEDAGHDAGPDADVDAGHDGGIEADAGNDAGPEVDGGTDGGPGVDGGPDADGGGPVACAEASTGSIAQWFNISTPYTVGGYVFTYTGKDATHAIFSITCGGTATVGSPLTCLIGSETPLEIPADGKRIRITPSSANAASSYANVVVENL